tara:strand:- start:570 stop:1205 length:636 start_codon:yes stop_codon:yes gene_type:complete
MALQSSGQIKLSEIAAEFGGSAPHSLSEYHGDGNAPSSGEIQLAADFYGTANTFSATVTWSTDALKSGNEALGYVGSGSGFNGQGFGGGTLNAMGSISAQPSSADIDALFRTCFSIAADSLFLDFDQPFTGWTSITVGSKTFNRSAAATPGNQGGTTNQRYQWLNANNSTSTYIDEDNASAGVHLDPFGSGTATGNQNGNPNGTVSITLNF